MRHAPLILALFLYVLIYLLRVQQGGWEVKVNFFSSLRSGLNLRIESLLPSPQAQLLSGILLGERKDLPASLRLNLRDTSTLHIVVVSGQNLTMLAALFLSLSGIFHRKIAILASLMAIIFYTILTGAQVPVLRAVIMVVLSYLAIFAGRQKDGFWVLLVTAGLMLLINPGWISDLSFQLSFLATFGVVQVAPLILKIFKLLPSFLSQDLAITISAQLMVIPIIAQSFHQFSIVSIFTNLLVGWSVPFIMILGSLMLIFPPLNILTNALLTYFIYVVQFFASLPFAWEYVGEKSWIVWLGYYLVLAGFMLSLMYGKNTTRK